MHWNNFLSRIAPVVLSTFMLLVASVFTYGQAGPASAPAGDYALGPEDVVQVWVWKEPDLSTTVMVRPDGRVSLPLVGEIDARGKTVIALQAEVRKGLETYISNPVVTVIVKEVNYPKFSVLGEVRKPDVYKMRQKITVLDAIALAGGFTEYANRGKVIVLRKSSSPAQEYELDLKHPNKDTVQFYLQPFDTVYVD